MLDYAANGVKYSPIAGLRADFERQSLTLGRDPGAISEVAPGTDPEDFWASVEQNLRLGACPHVLRR